ncbi:MAG TPA: hypothetical protein VL171_06075 [Verrucomicrobiae bacterium]|nr:hypothetical protein [Verrucomicrobiae bacterium]
MQDGKKGAEFKGDVCVDRLIKNVKVGDWSGADSAAIEILKATDKGGQNEVFESLVKYVDQPIDEDTLWGVLMTIESCAQLTPQWVDHKLLSRMANHPNFSVRASAASICMDWAQFASDLVPVDILLKLAVHNEDWYVQAPATAALQAMARSQPVILQIFYTRLCSLDPDARAHAAAALAGIADKEPEILDSGTLQRELARLKRIGDREARDRLAKAVPKVKRAKQTIRFKYGI